MVSRSEVVNEMTSLFPNPRYLEIGVANGETFLAVKADYKVAVDPRFNLDISSLGPETLDCQFIEVTSDEYFAARSKRDKKFHVIYLDGLHTFEQILRDFTNALLFLEDDGIIVIDDVAPTSYAAGLPDEGDAVLIKKATNDSDNSWMGDVYKLVYFIDTFFPSMHLRTVSDNHGQSVVWRSVSASRAFKARKYEEIGAMNFVDMVKEPNCFHKMTLAEISTEIAATRGQ